MPVDEAEQNGTQLGAHVDGLTDAGRDPIADLPWRFYIEYLKRHCITAVSEPSR